MWELDYKESWVQKNWCFWTVVLEKTLESPLDCKEIQPVHSEGNQSWVFIGRTDVEAEIPILWPPGVKSWLIWKDSDAGRDWGQEEKGTTQDEMVGWHHWLNGYEFGWTPGVGDGQGGLVCCGSWGPTSRIRLSHWTELMSSWVKEIRIHTKHTDRRVNVKTNLLKIWSIKYSKGIYTGINPKRLNGCRGKYQTQDNGSLFRWRREMSSEKRLKGNF